MVLEESGCFPCFWTNQEIGTPDSVHLRRTNFSEIAAANKMMRKDTLVNRARRKSRHGSMLNEETASVLQPRHGGQLTHSSPSLNQPS